MVITRMRKDSKRSRPAVLQGSSLGVGIHAKLDVQKCVRIHSKLSIVTGSKIQDEQPPIGCSHGIAFCPLADIALSAYAWAGALSYGVCNLQSLPLCLHFFSFGQTPFGRKLNVGTIQEEVKSWRRKFIALIKSFDKFDEPAQSDRLQCYTEYSV